MPTVEGLEERVVPATSASWTYTGTGGGDWSNPLNWQNGYVPQAGDNVYFMGGTSSCVLNDAVSIGSLNLDGGFSATLTLNKGITLTGSSTGWAGELLSGTIDQPNGAASDMYLNGGVFQFIGGVLNSTTSVSTIHIAQGAELDLVAGTAVSTGDNFDNSGTIHDNSTASVTFNNNAGITNNSGATIVIDQGDFRTSGTGQINNSGTIDKTYAFENIVKSELPINNISSSAVLWIEDGQLWDSGTSTTHGSSVYQASGLIELGYGVRTINHAGELRADSGFIMNGGTLKSLGTLTSSIDANVLVHAGDIYVCVNGNGAGTLSVGGAGEQFTMDGGTYHCAVDASGTNSDQLTTGGAALIGGNAKIDMFVLTGTGDLQVGDDWTVFHANGGTTGNFTPTDANNWLMGSSNLGMDLWAMYLPA
jgi:hypothetical protein